MIKKSFTVPDEYSHAIRVDKYVSDELGLLSRNQLKSRNLSVFLAGKKIKLSKQVVAGQSYELTLEEEAPVDLLPEDIALDILYEDSQVLVLNKASGMIVHPGAGNYSGTLANALLSHLKAHVFTASDRPGIVHRLDKDTSGVIITAKNTVAMEYLMEQFRERTARKIYRAIVKGQLPKKHDIMHTYICRDPRNRKKFMTSVNSGKEAITEYSVLKEFDAYSYVEIKLHTGRTHQIRVHMQSLTCPVLGDPIYSRQDQRFKSCGLMLHSYSLSIKIPGSEEVKTFTAPLPDRFASFLA